MVGSSVESYEKCLFFSVLSRLGPFLQGFGQVNEWPILEVYEMIRVLHLVALPIVFILFYGRYWQVGVFKVMRKVFYSVFNRLDLFAQVFRPVNLCRILLLYEMIRVLHAVLCPFIFILFYD